MEFIAYIAFVLFLISFIFMYPFVAVLRSDKVSGLSKLAWAILTLMFSWLIYPIFLLNTRQNKKPA